MEKRKRFNSSHVLVLLLAVISFIILYGIDVLDVTNDTWLLASERDLRAHYIGWKFFRQSPWNFPFGLMDNMMYPDKISIIFTDSVPVLAVFFKVFSGILPETFQYFGLWGLLCFILQGLCAYELIAHYVDNRWIRLIGTEFFIISPSMIYRLYYHSELAGHFLLLLAFLIFVKNRDESNSLKVGIKWSVLCIAAAGIHIYFIPMVGIVMVAMYCVRLKSNCQTGVLKSMLVGFLLEIVMPVLAACGNIYLLGGFSSARTFDSEDGLGRYSANLNTFFNSQSWSGILPQLKLYCNDQYEGYAYVGLGVIILLVITVIACVKKKVSFSRKEIGFAVLVFVVSFVAALSPVVTCGSRLLVNIPYPGFVIHIYEMFRATGRFAWLGQYVLMLAAVVGVGMLADGAAGNKKKIIVVIAFVTIGLQIADLQQMLFLRKNVGDAGQYQESEYNVLQSDVWEKLAHDYSHIVLVEENSLVHKNYVDSFSLADFAVNHGLTINNFPAARPNDELVNANNAKIYENLETGLAEDDVIYIFGNRFELLFKDLKLNIYLIDGFAVGVKGTIDGAEKLDPDVFTTKFGGTFFLHPPEVQEQDGVLFNDVNSSQYMVYGPYAEMEPGVYDITFDYDMIDAGDGSIGFAEVVSGDGAQVFASLEVEPDAVQIRLQNVVIPEKTEVEIRVFVYEGYEIALKRFTCTVDKNNTMEE